MNQPATGSRFERVTYWMVSTSPWACLALFWSFVLRARLALGRWPTPCQPDPKDLGFDFHHLLVTLSLPVAISMTVMAGVLVLVAIAWRWERATRFGLGTLILCVGWAALILYAKLDPGRFVEWFLD